MQPPSDSDILSRFKTKQLTEHFDMTPQGIYSWKLKGIPKQHRNSLVLLGESLNIDMSDVRAAQSV